MEEEENKDIHQINQAQQLAAYFSRFFLERLDRELDLYHQEITESPPESNEQSEE
ncbi:MAG: hypothetical protein KDC57_14570 [Saprospiraceae bacterium]|nr:hypothetical protein [Saprospiraceae bacterium]